MKTLSAEAAVAATFKPSRSRCGAWVSSSASLQLSGSPPGAAAPGQSRLVKGRHQGSADVACRRCHPNKEEKDELQYVATLVIAASAAAIGLAPIAAADSTVQQSPGNAQIVATPGAAAQEAAQNHQPFGGDSGALLYHYR
jgi:hypothetical protein